MELLPKLKAEDLSERALEVLKKYEEMYGCKPELVSEAPGRVNIIGEHIDYMGYGVLPMAIGRTTLVAIGKKDSDCFKVTVSNFREEFESVSMSFQNPKKDLKELDLTKRHHWTNYVFCGIKGIIVDECENVEIPKKEFMLLVDGNVPIGKGLSSSSSVNCAVTIAIMDQIGLSFSKTKLSKFTQVVERYIGMIGGGMDQAISIFGEKGFAKYVEFSPSIKVTSVQLKPGYCFVVSDSMVESNKNETASKYYNMRVVECRLGSALIGSKLKISGWNEIKTLWQLQQDMKLTLEEMEKLCVTHLPSETLTIVQIAEMLGMSVEDVRKVYLFNHQAGIEIKLMNEDSFKLRDRCMHVFSEARRVIQFIECTKKFNHEGADDQKVFEELGGLMDESHFSNRDLYEASCDELEILTKMCRKHGALGSRFTGAGFGGCCISLVPLGYAEEFIEKIWKEYYEPKFRDADKVFKDEFIFKSEPETGASLFMM